LVGGKEGLFGWFQVEEIGDPMVLDQFFDNQSVELRLLLSIGAWIVAVDITLTEPWWC